MDTNTAIALIFLFFTLIGTYCLLKTHKKKPCKRENDSYEQMNTITIKDFMFSPRAISIRSGMTIIWSNEDGTTHNIRSNLFSSPDLPKGASYSFKFDNPGTYDYYCGIDPMMDGMIIVR